MGHLTIFKRAYAHKLNLLAGIGEVEPGNTTALPQHRSNPAFQLVLAIYKCKFERILMSASIYALFDYI